MERLPFTKMQGTGNDFIVVDNTSGKLVLPGSEIRKLSDRHFGIGFDQLLMIESSSTPDAEFDYRIFNADGGEVEHCGNGARCFAKYVTDAGMTDSRDIPVNTNRGRIVLRMLDGDNVMVKMGVPEFEPASIPLQAPGESLLYEFSADENLSESVELGAVAIGNPHAVIAVDDVDLAPVNTLGPQLERHSRFPDRVNVGFMQIINASNIRLRVFERGVGETRACGTGACAAVAVGVRQKILQRRVSVELPGGSLEICWPEDGLSIEMTGPCAKVFEGHIEM